MSEPGEPYELEEESDWIEVLPWNNDLIWMYAKENNYRVIQEIKVSHLM